MQIANSRVCVCGVGGGGTFVRQERAAIQRGLINISKEVFNDLLKKCAMAMNSTKKACKYFLNARHYSN